MRSRILGRKVGCAALVGLALTCSAWADSSDIVISQVYGGGGNSGSTYTNDFIELFNRGTATVDVTGWSVQYASRTGSTWQVTDLSGTIAAGQYYLVQEAQGSGGTTPLPTPDAIGNIAMSSSQGKVALVDNNTALTGTCPLASAVDFVGYGPNANCFEGSGPAPQLSNTNAGHRAQDGCQDTDDNAADFTAELAEPRNTASPLNPCTGPMPGACCLANGFCQVLTEAECQAKGGTFQGSGTTCIMGLCPGPLGACCLIDGSCQDVTEGDCVNFLSGTFQGNGTACATTQCPQPKGACCISGVCSELTQADCIAAGGQYLGNFTTCQPAICPLPVQSGDIALGLSRQDPAETAEHIRGGVKVASWPSQSYLQAMEFDNAGGTAHNGGGNLLALNFGTTTTGGELYNLATDGTNDSELLYQWNTAGGGIETTRIGGLSVSPNNNYLAAWGPDTGNLYVLAYNAGGAVGTGSGASITGAWVDVNLPTSGGTQGTTWLDADTVLVYCTSSVPGTTKLYAVDFDGSSFTETEVATILVPVTGPSQFTDVEYNSPVADYVFCMYSAFSGGVGSTTLTVMDPSNWSQVNQIDLSTSLQTGREIALGPDKNLYLSQYAGSAAPKPRVYIDRILDATNAANWTSNSSVDYYTAGSGDGVSSSYNGIDAAFGGAPPACPGDFNCDGKRDFDDIDPFVEALSTGQCACPNFANCDPNGDGKITFDDIDPFILVLGVPCP